MHIGTDIKGIETSYSLQSLCRIIDTYHVSKAAVSSLSETPSILERENKKLIQIGMRNPKIYPLLRILPAGYRKRHLVKKLRENIENHLVFGIKVNASIDGVPITSKLYEDVLNMLNEEEVVLLLHCGRLQKMSSWKHGIKVAKRHNNLKVILAHMGGTHPDYSYKAIAAAKRYDNVYLETSQVGQPQVIRRAIETVGASKVLFGSDVPWGGFLQNLVSLSQTISSEKVIYDVTRGNFCRLMQK
jgi:predicted TIM-barrel fold metal-dependent hydrolase